MQPHTGKQIGWLGVLLVAIASGLIIKVVGDPIVEITSPKIEKFLRKTQDSLEDQNFPKKIRKLLEERD
jgi:hypothetical protein